VRLLAFGARIRLRGWAAGPDGKQAPADRGPFTDAWPADAPLSTCGRRPGPARFRRGRRRKPRHYPPVLRW